MFRRFWQIGFIVALVGWAGTAVAGGDLYALRLGAHPGKIRAVIDLDAKTPYRVFALSDPYRVVIDLPEVRWHIGNNKDLGRQTLIRDFRHSNRKNGYTRVVLDAGEAFEILDVFSLPAVEGLPHRLVIDLKPVSSGRFAETKSRIFGDAAFGPDTIANAVTAPTDDLSFASLVLGTPAPGTAIPAPKPRQTAPGGPGIPSAKPSVQKKTIVIDPGHGGQDPGAIASNGVYEKHITLAVAKELKRALEARGQYNVVLTRSNDRYLKLHYRVFLARKAKGDLFISLHADTIHKSNVRGTSVYTLSENASDTMSAQLAEQENKVDMIAGIDLSHEQQDVANILIDLATRETMNESKRFANLLVGRLKNDNIRLLPNSHRFAGFAVLKAPDIPSVLIELGFLSSPKEAELLQTRDYQRRIAAAIANGVDGYFTKLASLQRM